MSSRIRRVTGWTASIALTIGLIALSGAPANASATDDLAWIGTSAAQPTSDALQIMAAGSSTPSSVVTQPPTLGNVLAAAGSSLYFVQNGSLVRSGRDGSGITTISALASLPTPLTTVYGLTVAGTNIYVMDSTTGVWMIPLAGGSATKVNNGGLALASWQTYSAQPLAVTGTILYWAESDGLHSWTLGGTAGTENPVILNSVFESLSGAPSGIAPLSIATNGDDIALFAQTGSGIASLFQRTSGTWSYVGYPSYSVMYAVGIAMSSTSIYFSDWGGSVYSFPSSGTRTDNTATTVFAHNYDSEAVVYLAALPSHSVAFNANGGTGTMSNQSSASAANLTSNSFTRAGYTFSGWNTAANGSGTSYANGANFPFSADTTLYAQWTADSSPAGGGSSALPATGFSPTPIAWSGAALLMLGLIAAAVAWRRRRTN